MVVTCVRCHKDGRVEQAFCTNCGYLMNPHLRPAPSPAYNNDDKKNKGFFENFGKHADTDVLNTRQKKKKKKSVVDNNKPSSPATNQSVSPSLLGAQSPHTSSAALSVTKNKPQLSLPRDVLDAMEKRLASRHDNSRDFIQELEADFIEAQITDLMTQFDEENQRQQSVSVLTTDSVGASAVGGGGTSSSTRTTIATINNKPPSHRRVGNESFASNEKSFKIRNPNNSSKSSSSHSCRNTGGSKISTDMKKLPRDFNPSGYLDGEVRPITDQYAVFLERLEYLKGLAIAVDADLLENPQHYRVAANLSLDIGMKKDGEVRDAQNRNNDHKNLGNSSNTDTNTGEQHQHYLNLNASSSVSTMPSMSIERGSTTTLEVPVVPSAWLWGPLSKNMDSSVDSAKFYDPGIEEAGTGTGTGGKEEKGQDKYQTIPKPNAEKRYASRPLGDSGIASFSTTDPDVRKHYNTQHSSMVIININADLDRSQSLPPYADLRGAQPKKPKMESPQSQLGESDERCHNEENDTYGTGTEGGGGGGGGDGDDEQQQQQLPINAAEDCDGDYDGRRHAEYAHPAAAGAAASTHSISDGTASTAYFWGGMVASMDESLQDIEDDPNNSLTGVKMPSTKPIPDEFEPFDKFLMTDEAIELHSSTSRVYVDETGKERVDLSIPVHDDDVHDGEGASVDDHDETILNGEEDGENSAEGGGGEDGSGTSNSLYKGKFFSISSNCLLSKMDSSSDIMNSIGSMSKRAREAAAKAAAEAAAAEALKSRVQTTREFGISDSLKSSSDGGGEDAKNETFSRRNESPADPGPSLEALKEAVTADEENRDRSITIIRRYYLGSYKNMKSTLSTIDLDFTEDHFATKENFLKTCRDMVEYTTEVINTAIKVDDFAAEELTAFFNKCGLKRTIKAMEVAEATVTAANIDKNYKDKYTLAKAAFLKQQAKNQSFTSFTGSHIKSNKEMDMLRINAETELLIQGQIIKTLQAQEAKLILNIKQEEFVLKETMSLWQKKHALLLEKLLVAHRRLEGMTIEGEQKVLDDIVAAGVAARKAREAAEEEKLRKQQEEEAAEEEADRQALAAASVITVVDVGVELGGDDDNEDVEEEKEEGFSLAESRPSTAAAAVKKEAPAVDPLAEDSEYLAYLQAEIDKEKDLFLKRQIQQHKASGMVGSGSGGGGVLIGLQVGDALNVEMKTALAETREFLESYSQIQFLSHYTDLPEIELIENTLVEKRLKFEEAEGKILKSLHDELGAQQRQRENRDAARSKRAEEEMLNISTTAATTGSAAAGHEQEEETADTSTGIHAANFLVNETREAVDDVENELIPQNPHSFVQKMKSVAYFRDLEELEHYDASLRHRSAARDAAEIKLLNQVYREQQQDRALINKNRRQMMKAIEEEIEAAAVAAKEAEEARAVTAGKRRKRKKATPP